MALDRVKPPPSFSGYDDAGHGPDTRFDGHLSYLTAQRKQRSVFNVFARVWDWATRSAFQVDLNKRTANLFIREMGQKYGDSIGNMASRQLSAHTARGRPLTQYRINEILRKANDMIETNAQKNQRNLRDMLGSITEQAVHRVFGGAPWGVVFNSSDCLDSVRKAIESHASFTEALEYRRSGEFAAFYAPIAEQALKDAVAEMLAPESTGYLKENGDPTTGLAPDIKAAFGEAERILDEVRAAVSRPRPAIPEHEEVMRDLRHYGRLRCELRELEKLAEKLEESGAEAQEYCQALRDDLGALEIQLEQRLGLWWLGAEAWDAVTGMVDNMAGKNIREQLEILRASAAALANAQPTTSVAVALRDTILSWAQNMDVAYADPDEVDMLDAAGFNLETADHYREFGIPILPGTMPRAFLPGIAGDYLDGGDGSPVYEVKYDDRYATFVDLEKNPWQPDGISKALGIDDNNPRFAQRMVAAGIVDGLLGFELVPRTEVTAHGGRLGVAMQTREHYKDVTGEYLMLYQMGVPPKEGQTREEALREWMKRERLWVEDGRIYQDIATAPNAKDFKDSDVQIGLIRLQLFDALTGQGNRTAKNYVIQRDTSGDVLGVRAIETRYSFGTSALPDSPLSRVGLPEVVDEETARAFEELEPDTLREALAGLLEEDEIEAAVTRLDAIKTHLAGLRENGFVISREKWPNVVDATYFDDRETSYIARDRDR